MNTDYAILQPILTFILEPMEQAETKYRYRDRLWTWEELDDYLNQAYSEEKFTRPTRITLALEMVEGEKVLDIAATWGRTRIISRKKGIKWLPQTWTKTC